MDNKITKTTASTKKNKAESPSGFTFGKKSYTLLLIGIAFIALGFILMVGGGSEDPNEFNPEIFNFQRITLAPILILIGYVIEIFAIMKKPKESAE